MVKQPWSEFLESEDYLAQFTELTGIDVTYEILPEDQFRQKTTIEFAAGTSDVDVFLSMVARKASSTKRGWYTDFAELLADDTITDPNFDFEDFTDSSLSIATLPNGKLIGLPVYTEFGALFYNKALLTPPVPPIRQPQLKRWKKQPPLSTTRIMACTASACAVKAQPPPLSSPPLCTPLAQTGSMPKATPMPWTRPLWMRSTGMAR